jgi:hypothetical protein
MNDTTVDSLSNLYFTNNIRRANEQLGISLNRIKRKFSEIYPVEKAVNDEAIEKLGAMTELKKLNKFPKLVSCIENLKLFINNL